MTDPLWQDQASCRGANPEQFWSDSSNDAAVEAMRETAQQYCATCPALAACAEDADNSCAQGLWGGSLRTGATNKYRRIPLIDNAPQFPLTNRRAGVSYGWKTA